MKLTLALMMRLGANGMRGEQTVVQGLGLKLIKWLRAAQLYPSLRKPRQPKFIL